MEAIGMWIVWSLVLFYLISKRRRKCFRMSCRQSTNYSTFSSGKRKYRTDDLEWRPDAISFLCHPIHLIEKLNGHCPPWNADKTAPAMLYTKHDTIAQMLLLVKHPDRRVMVNLLLFGQWWGVGQVGGGVLCQVHPDWIIENHLALMSLSLLYNHALSPRAKCVYESKVTFWLHYASCCPLSFTVVTKLSEPLTTLYIYIDILYARNLNIWW